MTYGPQDWDLLAGIGRPGSDPRVWRHKACGECLEFPDDTHRCQEVPQVPTPQLFCSWPAGVTGGGSLIPCRKEWGHEGRCEPL
jgi:hypothetical protein